LIKGDEAEMGRSRSAHSRPAPVANATTVGEAITLSNGHRLGFAQCGDPDGKPLVFLHGTPGSRVEGLSLGEAARRHGVRIIAPERPGYGKSDYWRARTVADLCALVVELPDRLGLDGFSVLGVSGGGPYALGFGYLFPQRIDSLTLVSSRGLGFRGGMPGLGAALAALSFLSERLPGLPLDIAAWRARRHPGVLIDRLNRQVGSRAREADVGRIIYDDLQEAFALGSRGTGADLKRSRRWGFEPEQVSHPVVLWHGEDDRQVLVAAARSLTARLPSVNATFTPHEGHLDVFPTHIDEILRGV